jgi:type I restriction enzyme S subunit
MTNKLQKNNSINSTPSPTQNNNVSSLNNPVESAPSPTYSNISSPTYPQDWQETTLGEVCEIKSGSTPSTKEESFWGGEISWITPKDLSNYNSVYISRGEKSITTEGLKNSSAQLLPKDTILFSSRAPIGYVAIARNELTTNQGFKNLVCDEKNSHFRFFYYLLKEKSDHIEKLSSGSTFSEASASLMKSIPILLPPLPEQKAIASVLSSFDDKIELLREQNKTLEEMGQTIFKEWFGKYGVDDDLPEGWKVGKITEIIKREPVSYKCDKKDLDPKGKTPIIDQGSNALYGYTSREPDFIATKENPVIVFTNHTCNYWFVDYPFCAIQNVLPYRGKDGYDEYFLYFMTKGSITFIEYKGHWPDFEAKDFVIPSAEIAQKFSKIAKPILEKISDNNSQIHSLARSRDELLPKLMSGQVRLNYNRGIL